MINNPNIPKRHHYLTQSYLQGFCRDGKLWVYNLIDNKYTPQTPINTAVIGHYYSFEEDDGEKNPIAETKYMSFIDGLFNPVMKKIRAREILNKDDKYSFSEFIALQYTRVPEFEKTLNGHTEDFVKKFMEFDIAIKKNELGKNPDSFDLKNKIKDAEELAEFIHSDKIDISLADRHRISATIKLSREVAELLYKMNWTIIIAPERSSFITSDNPFMLMPTLDYLAREKKYNFVASGIDVTGVMKAIPLDSKHFLFIGDRGNAMFYHNFESKEVSDMNKNITNNCQSYIYGRDKLLLQSLVKSTQINERKDSNG